MTSNFSFTTKAAVVALSLLTAIAFSGAIVATPTAHGQTVDELQQQIASLLAQIQQLQSQLSGTPSASAYNFTRNLTVGSSGADVTALQNYLISEGFSIPAGATGYFGEQTRSAVAAWQAANGVSPAAGYFGPLSRAKYNELVAASAPDEEDEPPVDEPSDPSTPSLSGDEGDMDVSNLSLTSHDIDFGQSEDIYEVEVEAVDSDIAVNRIDYRFSHRPWLYFSEVALHRNGSEIASLSGSSAFTQISGEWRARFTGLNEVITEGNFAEFSLEATVHQNLHPDRATDTVVVYMPRDGIRGVDGSGLVQYAPDSGLATTSIDFTDTFGEGDLNLTLGDNSPESETYVVEENNRTNNQLILAFEARADGGSINVKDVVVNATTSTGDPLTDMIHRARLYMNGSVVDNVAPGASSLSFVDLDRVIANNATADFEVEIDFRRTSVNDYAPVNLTIEDVVVDFEDQDFVSTDETLPIDESHDVIEEGLTDSFVSKSTDTQSDGTVGKFTFVFNVTAYGDTFYISEDEAFSLGANGSHTTTPTVEGGGTVTGVIMSSNASLTSGAYRINEGQTRQFTVEVFVTVGADGVQRVTLPAIEYGSTTAATGTSLELGSPDYRSGGIHLK